MNQALLYSPRALGFTSLTTFALKQRLGRGFRAPWQSEVLKTIKVAKKNRKTRGKEKLQARGTYRSGHRPEIAAKKRLSKGASSWWTLPQIDRFRMAWAHILQEQP